MGQFQGLPDDDFVLDDGDPALLLYSEYAGDDSHVEVAPLLLGVEYQVVSGVVLVDLVNLLPPTDQCLDEGLDTLFVVYALHLTDHSVQIHLGHGHAEAVGEEVGLEVDVADQPETVVVVGEEGLVGLGEGVTVQLLPPVQHYHLSRHCYFQLA